MARWRAELADIWITVEDIQRLAQELLGPDGRLVERKVFSRRDVLVAAAPHLFGHTPDVLEQVADRVLADPTAIPLIGVPGAKEPAFAPACVIAVEHAIEAVVDRGRDHTGAAHIGSRSWHQRSERSGAQWAEST